MRRRTLVVGVALAAACGGSKEPDGEPDDTAESDRAAAACPEPPAPVVLPCPEPEPADVADADGDALTLVPVSFDDLPGWGDDRHAEALPPFLASCEILAAKRDDEPAGTDPHSGRARDWRAACAAAARVPAGDHAAARAFFEAEFRPFAAAGRAGREAKLTGYFVQGLRGARERGGPYQTPILARPPDLVEVPLSDFISDGRGRRLWGRVDPTSGALVDYPTRAEIRKRPFGPTKQALLWVDDPVDAVFAEIEGSGRVILEDGGEAWIAFAGKNGRPFRGVGGILRAMGELDRGEGTMQGIRAWFEAHPARTDEIVDLNPSKVFFHISDRDGAVGTQGVVLTPRRSLAVDRGHIALSTPVWVTTDAPVGEGGARRPWRQLLIAQDTGGAIRGAIRGDVYWGAGEEAAAIGGRMGGRGHMWVLLPRGLK